MPPTVRVLDALKTPLTSKLLLTVEEATEIKPPSSFAKPATDKVEEADNGALTFKLPTIEEEAVERYPENVCKPVQVLLSVVAPGNLQTPPIAKQPVLILNPFWAVVVAVDEAFNPPVRTKVPLIVEEALEINPPAKVERSNTDKVEEADSGPLTLRLA